MNNKTLFGFPRTFYVANGMEIFERLAWYGFFTLSSLYMSTPVAQGGVGFSDAQRGALQGIIPFFLYLLPVFTGALADRYGYRRMFILSFAIMAPGYWLLGQTQSFGSFFVAFFAVALGAACFKPVVVGTIGRVTNDANRGMGFGIFYTMINVGGFIGPLVAGYMRAISWDWVFIMSSFWILVNFFPVIFLYKEPQRPQATSSLKEVLREAQLVLGNSRFALMVFPCIIMLMIGGTGWISYGLAFAAILAWLLINLFWHMAGRADGHKWYQQKVQISNKPFTLYLLILTGFWAVYNQLFLTLPLYIRDYVDTADLVKLIAPMGPEVVNFLASVNVEQLSQKLNEVAATGVPQTLAEAQIISAELMHLKVRVPAEQVLSALPVLQQATDVSVAANELATHWCDQYRQINPEYIVNVDFAAIVLCQIFVSWSCRKLPSVYVLAAGVVIFALGLFTAILAQHPMLGGSIVFVAVLLLATGEMVTSPKSQEYVASVAPEHQTALYMGYYFVSMALGFLFAGLLSGWSYGYLATELGKPEWMWTLFIVIALVTSVALLVFNVWLNKRNLSLAQSPVAASA